MRDGPEPIYTDSLESIDTDTVVAFSSTRRHSRRFSQHVAGLTRCDIVDFLSIHGSAEKAMHRPSFSPGNRLNIAEVAFS